MSDDSPKQITQLSDAELDAVGAGAWFNISANLSTNVYKSYISQYNSSYVSAGGGNYVSVNQSNNVGTTVVVDL